ncbi:MAG TPA: hybrid sensor histidine kinase/response regulator [Anaerolineae bacterium]|nr:hybrid sensor histidine kinase/response regulator [Anaerolineae bacterium]
MDQPKAVILYIEDDIASQRLVQRVLDSHGYKVYVAGEGTLGIALAREHRPNLILMDINLPGMTGKEITTRLRSLPTFSQTPIVALTANTGPGNREQALAAGCTGFLTKPINVLQFPKQVAEYLEGYEETMSDDERSEQLEIYAQKLVNRLEDKVYELQKANQRLRELDKMKSDFIVLVSHELRTPLTLISGYAYLLREKVSNTEDSAMKQMAHIAEGLNMGVDRLSGVIEEIISVSRVASGTLELSLGPVNLPEILEAVTERAHDICQARQLNINVSNFNHLPVIEADGDQLRVALDHIVGNAIKYTPDHGQINIHGKVMGNAIDITISDTGIGIPVEEQRHIFEQFYTLGAIQHHSTSKSAFQGGGLGIGLSVARGIVEAHNGRIWVESEKRDPETLPGSTFHLLVPIKQVKLS